MCSEFCEAVATVPWVDAETHASRGKPGVWQVCLPFATKSPSNAGTFPFSLMRQAVGRKRARRRPTLCTSEWFHTLNTRTTLIGGLVSASFFGELQKQSRSSLVYQHERTQQSLQLLSQTHETNINILLVL